HTKFIWLMGADNLTYFHLWQDWQKIARILPIAIFDRPEYGIKGLHSHFARRFARKRVSYQSLKAAKTPAWAFLTIPRHPGSATQIRNQVGDNWYANWKRKDT
ncbi:MAG: nicotinic acid mononucleotide adenylyltransferase, partial [Cohaesibacter sp.]|nr:nicotinic acid mononucleotide adenylyltransferase [Cohaesibacter sp.]